jgi:hypothetical protein
MVDLKALALAGPAVAEMLADRGAEVDGGEERLGHLQRHLTPLKEAT